MRIKVKTGGLLRRYLPEGSGSQCEMDIAAGATPLAVMGQLGLPAEDQYLVMLNGEVMQVARRGESKLAEND